VPPARLRRCGRHGSKYGEEQGNAGQQASVGSPTRSRGGAEGGERLWRQAKGEAPRRRRQRW
jgi:hypothetical protein